MSISQEKLNELIQEDYRVHEERLRVWMEVAEAELTAEKPREQIYGLLFWAQVEFHRRRVYLGLEKPDLERRGTEALRALGNLESWEVIKRPKTLWI